MPGNLTWGWMSVLPTWKLKRMSVIPGNIKKMYIICSMEITKQQPPSIKLLCWKRLGWCSQKPHGNVTFFNTFETKHFIYLYTVGMLWKYHHFSFCMMINPDFLILVVRKPTYKKWWPRTSRVWPTFSQIFTIFGKFRVRKIRWYQPFPASSSSADLNVLCICSHPQSTELDWFLTHLRARTLARYILYTCPNLW